MSSGKPATSSASIADEVAIGIVDASGDARTPDIGFRKKSYGLSYTSIYRLVIQG